MARPMMRILYVGWVGFGNLGDDLCRDLFIRHLVPLLRAQGREWRIETATYAGFGQRDWARFNPHLVVLGAGSLFTPAYMRSLTLAQQRGIPTATWGTGIDKLSQSQVAALLEARAPQLGGDREAAGLAGALDRCRWAGVRGPHTFRVLRTAGSVSPRLHVCGDPGLLLAAGPSPAAPEGLPARWLADKAPLIGVNWGTANQQVFGGDEGRVEGQLALALRRLAADYRIVLFPVWGPDQGPVRRLAERIGRHPRVAALSRVPTGRELAALLSRCRFTINFKLHANVFSAALDRPFISLAYRSKCYDFAASVGRTDAVIPFSRPEIAAAVEEAARRIEERREAIVARMARERRRHLRSLRALLRAFARMELKAPARRR